MNFESIKSYISFQYGIVPKDSTYTSQLLLKANTLCLDTGFIKNHVNAPITLFAAGVFSAFNTPSYLLRGSLSFAVEVLNCRLDVAAEEVGKNLYSSLQSFIATACYISATAIAFFFPEVITLFTPSAENSQNHESHDLNGNNNAGYVTRQEHEQALEQIRLNYSNRDREYLDMVNQMDNAIHHFEDPITNEMLRIYRKLPGKSEAQFFRPLDGVAAFDALIKDLLQTNEQQNMTINSLESNLRESRNDYNIVFRQYLGADADTQKTVKFMLDSKTKIRRSQSLDFSAPLNLASNENPFPNGQNETGTFVFNPNQEN